MIQATTEDVTRFLSYVEPLPSGCWYWTGGRSRGKGNRKWYGSFRVGKQTVRAHRFSAEVLGRVPCPPGHHRDHVCSFSMCVNPVHIEVVTHAENEKRKKARRANHQEVLGALDSVPPAVFSSPVKLIRRSLHVASSSSRDRKKGPGRRSNPKA